LISSFPTLPQNNMFYGLWFWWIESGRCYAYENQINIQTLV
jgi:hypothetical protein